MPETFSPDSEPSLRLRKFFQASLRTHFNDPEHLFDHLTRRLQVTSGL